MKIVDSNVLLSASRQSSSFIGITMQRKEITDDPSESENDTQNPQSPEALEINLSQNAMEGIRSVRSGPSAPGFEADFIGAFKFKVMLMMIERLSGKKIDMKTFQDVWKDDSSFTPQPPQTETVKSAEFQFNYHELRLEEETTEFSAQAVIRTEDGREISVNIDLAMSWSFMETLDIQVETEKNLLDPLILNFSGTAAQLTDETFRFDLNSNGTEENVPLPGPNSGFLALDKNGDGIINNGGELFGPTSGDGFMELKAYDEDGNGFIDEGDSIFMRLSIVEFDGEGRQILSSLEERGIAAISLTNVETPFDIRDQENETLGKVRASGFYLTESGQPGIIQQVDLVV